MKLSQLKQIIKEEINESLEALIPVTVLVAIAASAVGAIASNKVEELIYSYKRDRQKKEDLKVKIEHDENVAEIMDIMKKDRTMLRLITSKNLKDAVVHARALLRKKKIENPVGISKAIKSIKDIFY
jgi:acyl-coenzyme A synthetase/AMP-(fatty) acid ligase